VFHRALYFGVLLAAYQGMRRDEIAGLAVADVIVAEGLHPHLHVCFYEFRRLKNERSIRNLVIHPELLRSGLLDYRAAYTT